MNLINGEITNEMETDILKKDPAYPKRAIYTSLRTYKGFRDLPFKIEEHLQRLEASARLKGFELPHNIDQIRTWIKELLERTTQFERFIKVVVTPTNTLILNRIMMDLTPHIYQGVKVSTTELIRPDVKVKSCDKRQLDTAYTAAQHDGRYEALLVDPNTAAITEGSRSNILYVKDGTLYWCDQALSGITQGIVLEEAKKLKTPVMESALPVGDIGTVDEMFLTQTSKGIVPIVKVDDQVIRDGKAGQMTKQLMKAFTAITCP